MSSLSSRSGSRRSRSRSRSRVPARRRYSRSRSQSGSEGESYGGSSQTDRRDYSRSSARKDHSRKRRRSRSEDLDSTPHRHTSNALVPVGFTRHAEEESSDTSEGDDEGTVKCRTDIMSTSKISRGSSRWTSPQGCLSPGTRGPAWTKG